MNSESKDIWNRGTSCCLICNKIPDKGGKEFVKSTRGCVHYCKLIFETDEFNLLIQGSQICLKCVGRIHQIFDFDLIKRNQNEIMKTNIEKFTLENCFFCTEDQQGKFIQDENMMGVLEAVANTKWAKAFELHNVICYSCYNHLLYFVKLKKLLTEQKNLFLLRVNRCKVVISQDETQEAIIKYECSVSETEDINEDSKSLNCSIIELPININVDEDSISKETKGSVRKTSSRNIRKRKLINNLNGNEGLKKRKQAPVKTGIKTPDINDNTGVVDKFESIKLRRSNTRPIVLTPANKKRSIGCPTDFDKNDVNAFDPNAIKIEKVDIETTVNISTNEQEEELKGEPETSTFSSNVSEEVALKYFDEKNESNESNEVNEENINNKPIEPIQAIDIKGSTAIIEINNKTPSTEVSNLIEIVAEPKEGEAENKDECEKNKPEEVSSNEIYSTLDLQTALTTNTNETFSVSPFKVDHSFEETSLTWELKDGLDFKKSNNFEYNSDTTCSITPTLEFIQTAEVETAEKSLIQDSCSQFPTLEYYTEKYSLKSLKVLLKRLSEEEIHQTANEIPLRSKRKITKPWKLKISFKTATKEKPKSKKKRKKNHKRAKNMETKKPKKSRKTMVVEQPLTLADFEITEDYIDLDGLLLDQNTDNEEVATQPTKKKDKRTKNNILIATQSETKSKVLDEIPDIKNSVQIVHNNLVAVPLKSPEKVVTKRIAKTPKLHQHPSSSLPVANYSRNTKPIQIQRFDSKSSVTNQTRVEIQFLSPQRRGKVYQFSQKTNEVTKSNPI